jgi:hypothetical protein
MHFRVTGDTDAKSGVADLIYAISGPTRKHFIARDYGVGLAGIGVVLMCQDPKLELRPRIRHSKKEKMLYVDVMLSLPDMLEAKSEARRSTVFRELIAQVGAILEKRKISDFAHEQFISDLHDWLSATDLAA